MVTSELDITVAPSFIHLTELEMSVCAFVTSHVRINVLSGLTFVLGSYRISALKDFIFIFESQ